MYVFVLFYKHTNNKKGKSELSIKQTNKWTNKHTNKQYKNTLINLVFDKLIKRSKSQTNKQTKLLFKKTQSQKKHKHKTT